MNFTLGNISKTTLKNLKRFIYKYLTLNKWFPTIKLIDVIWVET